MKEKNYFHYSLLTKIRILIMQIIIQKHVEKIKYKD